MLAQSQCLYGSYLFYLFYFLYLELLEIQKRNQMMFKKFLPVAALFMLLNAIGFYSMYFLSIQGIKISFILVVNAMLFVLSLFSFWRIRNMDLSKPNQMVQSVMMGTLIKMMIFAIAALIYARQQLGPVGLMTLCISMGIYLMYTFLEVQWTLKK